MKGKNYVKIGLLIATSLWCMPAYAQILVGPIAGAQMCLLGFGNKDNKELYHVRPFLGFHAGGSLAFRVSKDFFLQTSVLYSWKGKHLEGKEDSLFRQNVNYQYIDVPILFTKELKLKAGNSRYYKIYLGAGPQVSYWIGGKGVLANSDLNENGINPPAYDLPYHVTFTRKDPADVAEDEMNIQVPNRIQLALNFSAGVILEPDPFNRIMVSLQYSMGHSFLSDESHGDFGHDGVVVYKDDLQTRFHTISLSAAYFIDLQTETKDKGKSTMNKKRRR
jgi:hypothetical protein